MAEVLNITVTGRIDGETNTQSIAVSADNSLKSSPSVTGAKTGTLTTRTDANTGVLTMSGGHGLLDADKVDLFWSGGQRRNMTVGTVATNSVPIDGGSGDDLPTAATAITAKVPQEEAFTVDGDNVTGLTAYSPKQGYIVLCEADDTPVKTIEFDAAGGYNWGSGMEGSNPLAGGSITKVKYSHASTDSQTMKCAAVYD